MFHLQPTLHRVRAPLCSRCTLFAHRQGHFEQKVIPTITFPSDHVLVKAMLSFENEVSWSTA
eukprot:1014647-Rhodomonas_salina.1